MVDFIAPKHFAVFNLADSAIVVRRHPDRAAVLPRPRPGRHRPPGLSRRPAGRRAAADRPVRSAAPVRHTRRVSTLPEIRTLPVPDGLEGERVDAAIARMFGFSRTKAAELAAGGQGDGRRLGGGQVRAGARRAPGWRSRCPAPAAPVRIVAEPVEGMEIVHDDDDVVVIVKPVGVAAHPSPGWTGPTVIGGLAARRLPDLHLRRRRAPGHRAPAGRRHLGADGGGQVRARLHLAEAPVQGAHGRQALPRPGPGPPRPDSAAPSTPPSAATPATTTSGRSPPTASPPSRTTT